MSLFIIPADYCIALIDASAYQSFVDANWTLAQLQQHFVDQINQGRMLAWGTGAPGNWRISVSDNSGDVTGYREFTGRITATDKKLHLTSYDELTNAAQFQQATVPSSETVNWFLSIEPGQYDCRVVQLFDPDQAESEHVFNQESPHFAIELTEANVGKPNEMKQVPWFEANQ